MSSGTLLVISAPSGAGKTTILRRILAEVPAVSFSISHTTRPPRTGEQHGRDYYFVSESEFEVMRDDDAFLEWARVHDNYYGTSRKAVEAILEQGRDVLLDIDVQGAAQLRQRISDAVLIFIAPPSLAELENRLRGRGTDSEAVIELRLRNARQEMERIAEYDHLVINDNLDEAVDMVRAVILAVRSRHLRRLDGSPVDMAALGR